MVSVKEKARQDRVNQKWEEPLSNANPTFVGGHEEPDESRDSLPDPESLGVRFPRVTRLWTLARKNHIRYNFNPYGVD